MITTRPRRDSIEIGALFTHSETSSVNSFGGVKRSGYGYELGEAGIKEFANRKLIVTTTAPAS